MLTVRPQRSFGESIVKIGFEGRAYVPAADGRGDSSVDSKTMQAYNDKIGCSYRLGYNSIRIVIRRKKIVSVGYALFSRMLDVVMFTLLFFFFLAILTALLPSGFTHLLVIVQFVILVILSLVVMAAFYLIRLLVGGVNIGAFLKHLPSLIWENIKINSAISAVPFNIRHCAQNYGYSRKSLSAKLPILAETNLDGNCYLIMLITMLFIFLLGVETSWLHILEIAILILFLSLGAPNQPGSIAIGILIITFFLEADALIAVAIYAEVFFGAIQNIINVIGDIVTVAIEESKARE